MDTQPTLDALQGKNENEEDPGQRATLHNTQSTDTIHSLASQDVVEGSIVESALIEDNNQTDRIVKPVQKIFLISSFSILLVSIVLTPSIFISVLLPLVAPSATISIIPSEKLVTTVTQVKIVHGTQPLTPNEIAGRNIASRNLSLTKDVKTTGIGHQAAMQAEGYITFYNASPSPQMIDAGELLVGADGKHVVTSQIAFVPGAIPPIEGEASVLAHAIDYGPSGNIIAGDINGECCKDYIYARNNTPFSGGADARNYRMVLSSDIDSAASSMRNFLYQSILTNFETQISSNETLLTPLLCNSSIQSSHLPNDEASSIKVTLIEVCHTQAYNTISLSKLASTLLSHVAGEGYVPLQNTELSTFIFDAKDDSFKVRLSGKFVYQFSSKQIEMIRQNIAGKTLQQARTILLQIRAIEHISISFARITLPQDPTKIHIILLYKAI